MNKFADLKVAVSPITGRIFAGSVSKDGTTWLSNKTDVTGLVMKAIIDKCGVGNAMMVEVNGVPTYEIAVTAVPPKEPK